MGWQPLAYLCRRFFRFLLWLREDLDIFRSLEETSSESAERQAAAVGWGSLPAGHPQTGPDTAAPFSPAARAEAFVAIALRTGPAAGRSFQPGAAPVRVPALLPVPAPVLVPVRAARGDRPFGPRQGSRSPLSPPESFAGIAVVSLLKCRARRAQQNRKKMGKLQPPHRGRTPAAACPRPGILDFAAETPEREGKIEVYEAARKIKNPGKTWCLSAAPRSPEVSLPGGVKGRAALPLPRGSKRGTEPGPAFRWAPLCAAAAGVGPRSGPVAARSSPPPSRRGGPCCGRGRHSPPGPATASDGSGRSREEAGCCARGRALLPAAPRGPAAAWERGLRAGLQAAAAV